MANVCGFGAGVVAMIAAWYQVEHDLAGRGVVAAVAATVILPGPDAERLREIATSTGRSMSAVEAEAVAK